MSVYKRFNKKKVKRGDQNYDRGTWYYRFVVRGKIYHQAIPEATTAEKAREAERSAKNAIFANKYGLMQDETTFEEFVANIYIDYVNQHNVNIYSKKIYIDVLKEYFGKMPLKSITPQNCRNFIARRKATKTIHERTRAASSINKELSTLSKILNLAIEENKIETNPMRFVKMLKEPPARDRVLSPEEWTKFYEEIAKDKKLYRLALIAMHTGLRRGQILEIEAEDIDLDKRLLKAGKSKGREERYIALNQTMVDLFTTICSETSTGKIFKFQNFRKRWDTAMDNAGIKNFTFHGLKHSFATELVNRGVHPNIVQMLFAHSSMEMTKKYIHLDMSIMFDAVNRLDDVIQVSSASN